MIEQFVRSFRIMLPALCALAAIAAACPAAASPPNPDTAPLGRRFEARGDGWRLTIDRKGVKLVEKLGEGRWVWYGGPPRRAPSNGLTYEGELTHSYAVANEGITDERSYRLEIARLSCRDDKGRTSPITVTITYDGGDGTAVEHGCGGEIPYFPIMIELPRPLPR